jgi:hypothetical protein
MKNENLILHSICLCLAILSTCGWYSAEAENEVLRDELAAQNYTQHIHHEGN